MPHQHASTQVWSDVTVCVFGRVVMGKCWLGMWLVTLYLLCCSACWQQLLAASFNVAMACCRECPCSGEGCCGAAQAAAAMGCCAADGAAVGAADVAAAVGSDVVAQRQVWRRSESSSNRGSSSDSGGRSGNYGRIGGQHFRPRCGIAAAGGWRCHGALCQSTLLTASVHASLSPTIPCTSHWRLASHSFHLCVKLHQLLC